jgi:hypothetical protein
MPAAAGDELAPDCQQQHARACHLAPDVAHDQQTFSLPGNPGRGQGYTLEKDR